MKMRFNSYTIRKLEGSCKRRDRYLRYAPLIQSTTVAGYGFDTGLMLHIQLKSRKIYVHGTGDHINVCGVFVFDLCLSELKFYLPYHFISG